MESTLPRWQLHLCFLKRTPIRVHMSLFVLLSGILIYSMTAQQYLHGLTNFLPVAALVYFLEAALVGLFAAHNGLAIESILITPFGTQIKTSGKVPASGLLQLKLIGLLPYSVLLFFCLASLNLDEVKSLIERSEPGPSLLEYSIIFSALVLFTHIACLCPMIIPQRFLRYRQLRRSLALNIACIVFALSLSQFLLAFYFLILALLCLRQMSELRALELAKNYLISDVMIPASQLLSFSHGTLLSQAVRQVLRSEQSYFPVFRCGNFQGVLHRKEILLAAQYSDSEEYLANLLDNDFSSVSVDKNLATVLKRVFNAEITYPLCVLEQEKLCGIVLRDQLLDFLVNTD